MGPVKPGNLVFLQYKGAKSHRMLILKDEVVEKHLFLLEEVFLWKKATIYINKEVAYEKMVIYI